MTTLNKTEVLSMMDASLDSGLSFSANPLSNRTSAVGSAKTLGYIGDPPVENPCYGSTTSNLTCWRYWQDWYYPAVIRESYPVSIQERAQGQRETGFEIIKVLKDKKLGKLDKVSDFINLMDALISIL